MQEPTRSSYPLNREKAIPKARSGVSAFASWQRSLDEVIGDVILPGESPPDLVLMFASREYSDVCQDLVAQARALTAAGTLMGCFGYGCIGGGRELEHTPGLSMLALWLPEASFRALQIDQALLQSMSSDAFAALAGKEADAWIVLTEPYRMDVHHLIERLSHQFPGVPIVGGMTSNEDGSHHARLFINDEFFEGGAIALAMHGPYELVPIVTQACEPIGEPWTVTDVDRTAILTISGRPAIDVLIETVASLPTDQQRQAKRHLLVGFAGNEYREEFHRGDFLIRGVLGVDHGRAAIVVADRPRTGQTIQFQMRDALTADIDLHQHLLEARALLNTRKPIAAFLASCSGRGAGLFGRPDHDAAALQSAFAGLPVGGFSSVGEIGPIDDRIGLHSFAASIGLFVEKENQIASSSSQSG